MSKRVIILFCMVVFSLTGLLFRIICINADGYAQSAARKNSKTITVERQRGKIYDCNLRPLTNIYPKYYLAVKPTSIALSGLENQIPHDEFEKLAKNLSDGKPTLIPLNNKINETKDTRVIKANSRYNNKQIASHIIGYVDNEGNGVTAIEKSYNDYLNKDSGVLKVAFTADALGRILPGTDIEIRQERGNPNKGVILTIDTIIQKITENALDTHDIDCGCAVVIDVKTGEIKAMASRPNFSPNSLVKSLKAPNSPFINRCVNKYTVGSAFKAIVACSAIENDNIKPSYKYCCTGTIEKSKVKFSCYNKKTHGTIDMRQALIDSCNTYFINLANKMDMNSLLEMCRNMGLSKPLNLASNLTMQDGNLPQLDELNSSAAIANFAFGQGKLLATPLQMACAFSSIASGGYYRQPYLVRGFVDVDGKMTNVTKPKKKIKVMSKSTANKVSSMLKSVVDNHEKAKPNNTTACGKTATAQSGWFKNKQEVYHTWFVGYFPAEKPKYAVAVMKEFGVGGVVDCAPVFRGIVENVTELNG